MKTHYGVSIVICSHNGAQRLPQTLEHLLSQEIDRTISVEIILVDNASIDGVADVARRCWPEGALMSLRIVYEPRQGIVHARHKGFCEARYEFISFIDDDNWCAPDWVKIAYETMLAHPEAGACGGLSVAVCESRPPWWFYVLKQYYAVGPQGKIKGDVAERRGFLWGTGLVVRKSAWQRLMDNGFDYKLVGRTKSNDNELSYALRLAGWRLWYEPRLLLHHFIPSYRLKWSYLCALQRRCGRASVRLDAYESHLKKKEQLQRSMWQIKILLLLGQWRRGWPFLRGRFCELLRLKNIYDEDFLQIKEMENKLRFEGNS